MLGCSPDRTKTRKTRPTCKLKSLTKVSPIGQTSSWCPFRTPMVSSCSLSLNSDIPLAESQQTPTTPPEGRTDNPQVINTSSSSSSLLILCAEIEEEPLQVPLEDPAAQREHSFVRIFNFSNSS